jgi:hypothetical protein
MSYRVSGLFEFERDLRALAAAPQLIGELKWPK